MVIKPPFFFLLHMEDISATKGLSRSVNGLKPKEVAFFFPNLVKIGDLSDKALNREKQKLH